MQKLTGLIAAPFTPFNERGELALEQIGALAGLYRRNGISGAFIAGSTGEGAALSLREKIQLMEAWGALKTPDLQLTFMLGGTCLPDMRELAQRAVDSGMNAVSVLCPYYFKPRSVEDLVDFCAQVAAAAPELPLYYYHIPELAGGYFPMIRFLELANERIPNLAGIKYSYANIMDLHACLAFQDGKYDLLWGMDETLLSGLAVGVQGAVGSTYNYAAPLYHQILQAFREQEWEKAQSLQLKSVRLVELLVKYPGAGKAIMKMIGIDCGRYRLPNRNLSPAEYENLRQELEQLGFFEFCSNSEVSKPA